MLPPGIPDPSALQGMVTGKDLKALTEPYKVESADLKARNTGSARRQGQGTLATWGRRSKEDLNIPQGWKEKTEDWQDQTLALVWRMFRNTFRGSGTEGSDGDIPLEKTVYDVSGLSLHDTIWGQDGGPESDVVRGFYAPFYTQVFEYGEMRFSRSLNDSQRPLATAIFGTQKEDGGDDWYWRLEAANHHVMSFTWLCNGEDPFAYMSAVKNGPHDSLAAATFGTPEIAVALSSLDQLQHAKGVAEAAFGDADMVTALRETSLAGATVGDPAMVAALGENSLAKATVGTPEMAEALSDTDTSLAKATFGTPELAEATDLKGGIAKILFGDADGVAKAAAKDPVADRIDKIVDILRIIDQRLDRAEYVEWVIRRDIGINSDPQLSNPAYDTPSTDPIVGPDLNDI
jgi:hypothetical protein